MYHSFFSFLQWKLPPAFVDRILKGEVILEASKESSWYDAYLLKTWIDDINNDTSDKVILLEMHARLSRLAISNLPTKENKHSSIHTNEISHVERIAIYIAKNYCNPIDVSDVGEAVGLHPDYANTIFKKAFGSTLSEYIIEERISHAQRKLITTDINISSIAYACGFNSISWFNTSFKKINGCTPREFRTNNSPKLK